MKIDVSRLMTVKNFATKEGKTKAYIYKLIKEGRMNAFIIDGVFFIDIIKFPFIPVTSKR